MGMSLIEYLNVRYLFLYEILILYNRSCYHFQLVTLQECSKTTQSIDSSFNFNFEVIKGR